MIYNQFIYSLHINFTSHFFLLLGNAMDLRAILQSADALADSELGLRRCLSATLAAPPRTGLRDI